MPNGPLRWLRSWLEAESNGGHGVEILFTRHDDFEQNRPVLYESILRFFDIDPARFQFAYAGTAVAFSPIKSPAWQDALGPGQIERLNALIPQSWFDRFGWPRG